MDQRLKACRDWSGFTGKKTRDQIVAQQTWGGVPDNEMTLAAMHRINIVPANGSTMTYVNKLDPASDPQQSPDSCQWNDPPGKWGEQNASAQN